MTAPRPGWYPDPAGTAKAYRWWDGATWTEAVSDSPHLPAPVARAPRRSATRTAGVLVVCFALFVTAGLGVGLLIGGQQPVGSSAGPPLVKARSVPPSGAGGAGGPTGQLDPTTRLAQIGAASLRLPPTPYELYTEPMLLPGVFDVAFTADAVVHSRYDGRHHWTASVALAQLSPAVTSRDLESSVTSTIQAMTGHLFGGHQISASRRSSWDQAVDGHPGVMYTYRAGYRVKDLPSRYDDVSVLLVRLDDGSMVAALSSVPDDASAEVRRLARASLASLTIS